jgi:mannobiose 2-epimerase
MMLIRKALLYWGRHQRRFGVTSIDLARPSAADYLALGKATDRVLVRHDISPWFPRCVDAIHGGFNSGYSNRWRPLPAPKALVFQARMTWFAAQISERMTNDFAARFQGYALHGLNFLREVLWDRDRGGFFWNLNADGTLPPGDLGEKHAYGMAFAIYACASLARIACDNQALDLARQSFRWLDEHAHDSRHCGYHEGLGRDGTPLPYDPLKSPRDRLQIPSGYKSANTQIHLLEAFTELYRVWPDPILRDRLEELFLIVRNKMFVLPGCLNQFYTSDYRPIPALGSYGHDVETAYLLIEVARALGRPDNASTWDTARLLVDNALDHAFDADHGGFFDEGPAYCHATSLSKTWWTQAEALNALIFLHERFGADDLRYWSAFTQTWQFICRFQVDSRHGGWHETIWADNRPILAPKGHNWKDPYHSGRALMNASRVLYRLGHEELPPLQP